MICPRSIPIYFLAPTLKDAAFSDTVPSAAVPRTSQFSIFVNTLSFVPVLFTLSVTVNSENLAQVCRYSRLRIRIYCAESPFNSISSTSVPEVVPVWDSYPGTAVQLVPFTDVSTVYFTNLSPLDGDPTAICTLSNVATFPRLYPRKSSTFTASPVPVLNQINVLSFPSRRSDSDPW